MHLSLSISRTSQPTVSLLSQSLVSVPTLIDPGRSLRSGGRPTGVAGTASRTACSLDDVLQRYASFDWLFMLAYGIGLALCIIRLQAALDHHERSSAR